MSSSSALVRQVSWQLLLLSALASTFGLWIRGGQSDPKRLGMLMLMIGTFRAQGISAGQADGIQPRTSEILQVSSSLNPQELLPTHM